MKVTKKILGSFVLIGLGISSTFAVNTISCGNNLTCGLINPGEYIVLGNNTNSIGQYIQFRNSNDYKVFDFTMSINGGADRSSTYRSGEDLYSLAGVGANGRARLIKYNKVCEYSSGTSYTGAIEQCLINYGYNKTIEDFIYDYKGKTVNKYLLTDLEGNYGSTRNQLICAVYDNSIVCFLTFDYRDTSAYLTTYATDLGYLQDANFGPNYAEQYLTLGNTPLQGNNSGGGSGTGTTTTGTQLYCPPIKYQIDMYGYKYNTGLCYSNTEIVSGGQVTTVTPISIFDAFSTYQQYQQAYRLIANNCHTSTVNTVEECQTALQSLGRKPSEIMLKVINAELPIDKVYQYCHLQLNYTEEEKWSKSTCELKEEETYYATGLNGNTNSNPNPLQGYTDILQETDTILTPEDGSIFDAILPDGVLTWKDVIFNANFMSHFATLYTKITLMFRARPYQDGILPPVITSLLLLIILFKVYKK